MTHRIFRYDFNVQMGDGDITGTVDAVNLRRARDEILERHVQEYAAANIQGVDLRQAGDGWAIYVVRKPHAVITVKRRQRPPQHLPC